MSADRPPDDEQAAAVAAFWGRFCRLREVDPATPHDVWHFGNTQALADELAALVVQGRKQATASLALVYERGLTDWPVLGAFSVVTAFDGTPRAVIRTSRVETVPFAEVSEEHAHLVGEGDRTLAFWRDAHRAFFEGECGRLGVVFDESMPVVLERFRCVYPPEKAPGYDEYQRACDALVAGDRAELERMARDVASFPTGADPFVGDPWIHAAVSGGSLEALDWMLEQPIPFDDRGKDGYTPLHVCLEREEPLRHEVLRRLLEAGADPNQRGVNEWTPLHRAGARGDLEAIRILMAHGADPTLRTVIDNDLTPADEADALGQPEAARLIRELTR